jgi:hypothetical protein
MAWMSLPMGMGGAWFVGTFAVNVDKARAGRVQGKFIRWLRKELGSQVEYAATWEVTRAKSLHLNLVLAPWRYISQEILSRAWCRFSGGRMIQWGGISPLRP